MACLHADVCVLGMQVNCQAVSSLPRFLLDLACPRCTLGLGRSVLHISKVIVGMVEPACTSSWGNYLCHGSLSISHTCVMGPVDFGFDPFKLGEDPAALKWYQQAELQNGR